MLLCGVGFVTIGSRLPPVGGALLAIGIWLKIYPVLLIVIGLWNRSAWRRIAYAAGAAVLVALITLPIVPWEAYRTFWIEVLPARFDKTAVHISNQSLIAFLERFCDPVRALSQLDRRAGHQCQLRNPGRSTGHLAWR